MLRRKNSAALASEARRGGVAGASKPCDTIVSCSPVAGAEKYGHLVELLRIRIDEDEEIFAYLCRLLGLVCVLE